MSTEQPQNLETARTLAVQKCLDTDDGKVLYEVLRNFIKPDIVQIALDNIGRIDPLAVQYNEGKRSVMAHINVLINKDLSKDQQKKAEIRKEKK